MTSIIKLFAAAALLLAIPTECVVLYTQIQEARTQMATARNARDRQLAEARLAAENARTLLQAANNAAELKKAEADKLFADARATEEVAANAKGRQAAEAQIAVQKAEQEYQTAQNAERRAAAEADKTEADALTAKRFGETSIQRSRAEAAKAKADLLTVQSDIQITWKYPNSCTRFKTFPDCVEGLRNAVANGHWDKPQAPPLPTQNVTASTPVAPVAPPRPAEFQPSPYCVERLKAWNAAKEHGAFAVSKLGGCAWVAERPTQEDAVSYVMDQCAKNQRTCKIVAKR